MNASYPDNGEHWLPICEHDGSDWPCSFAALYVPSQEAARNGAKEQWCYGQGIKIKGCNIWTGILGGKPTHFQYIGKRS